MNDSDAIQVGGVGVITLTTQGVGSTNHTFDIGLAVPVSLGNLIWYDTNNNGQVDNGEFGVANVNVELYQDTNGNGVFDAGDALISTTLTSGSGYYTFTNLIPTTGVTNTYLVVVTGTNFVTGGALNGYQNSTPTVGATNTTNSRDNGINGTLNALANNGYIASRPISLTAGNQPTDDGDSALNPDGSHQPSVGVADPTVSPSNSNWTVDFGFYQLQLGNFVWHDINNNGQPDPGEPSLAGVTVRLLDVNNNVIAVTTTNASGLYTFTGMPAGVYTVEIVPPVGYSSTTGSNAFTAGPFEPGLNTFTGGTDNRDHGTTTGATIRSAPIILNPGDAFTNGNGNVIVNATGTTYNPTVDFGLWQPAALGNYVWFDTNRDGIQNEPPANGVNGVTVTLFVFSPTLGTFVQLSTTVTGLDAMARNVRTDGRRAGSEGGVRSCPIDCRTKPIP